MARLFNVSMKLSDGAQFALLWGPHDRIIRGEVFDMGFLLNKLTIN